MSMEDDLFNVPENDDEMMDGNEDDDEDDNGQYTQNDNGNEDNENDNDNGEEEEEDEDDDDEDDEDDDDNDNDDNEDNGNENDSEKANEEENDEENEDDQDETKFLDAKDEQSSPTEKGDNEEGHSGDGEKGSGTKNGSSSVNGAENGSSHGGRDEDAMDVDSDKPPLRETLMQKAKAASEFDIVPTMAIPYSTQCHAIAFTDGPKWIITGGEDGFIRKYDFIESIQGKSPLTMAQKHNLVDSVTKAGVINSYWENEQPLTKAQVMEANPKIKPSDFSTGSINYEPKTNPIYALEVERNGYWCLSGVLSGGISLYTMRYNEGVLQHYFKHGPKRSSIESINGHNDAVSALKLNSAQDKFLSGAWDKAIRQWDLNTGNCVNLYQGSTGQISNIQYRPLGLADFTLSVDTSTAEDDEKNSDMGSLFGDSDNENENGPRKKLESEDKSSKLAVDNSKITNKVYTNDTIFMSSCSDGTVNIWDVRTGNGPVIKYGVPEKTPPWCMSSTWSNCGDYIYVGRRNSTVDEFSIKMPHKRTANNKSLYAPNILKRLQFPKISGPVTALSTMPNNNFLLCGSMDNIRLYNLNLYNSEDPTNVTSSNAGKKTQATPFLIVPGHHGGVLSSLYVDPTGRFMVSASGNRGWGNANNTDAVLVYEIDFDY